MIYQIELWFRKLHCWFNRSEWLICLLGLKPVGPSKVKTGLIMIQIDGLSYSQLKSALSKKRMPFLQKLMDKEHYQLEVLFSGAPSTTPAVQAELFYGVKTAVPAFSFKSQTSDKVVQMNQYQASVDVENQLKEQAEPLLKGGSSYSNIYRGGAKEANFCASSIGWSQLMKMTPVWKMIIFIVLNLYSFLRVTVLIVVEFLLAFVDFFRGIIARKNLMRELKFVPTRVVISILLRELVTIGAKLDIARGFPIIHLNLLGYDEQAHRRGPGSAFAHWSLKGIDDAIGRIWRAAKSSSQKDYEIWIYSDHGQEETQPYERLHGETVSQAINRVFSNFEQPITSDTVITHIQGTESHRARYLGGKWMQKLTPFNNVAFSTLPSSEKSVIVTATGPLGSIYLAHPLSRKQTEKLAMALVRDAKIPLIFICNKENVRGAELTIKAFTKNAEYDLPKDRTKIFGKNHPFLEEITEDIMRLCQHAESGELLISGFSPDKPYCTFAMENGSHGGPGPEETRAFALLPYDTPMPVKQKAYLRPADLYEIGLHTLGRNIKPFAENSQLKPLSSQKRPKQTSLRILTYNVHSCFCMDGKLAPKSIAKVIAHYKPDIVALQELDVGRPRTQHADQAHIISKYLQMEYHFHPVIHVEEEQYGNAILTHLPIKLIKAGNLPLIAKKPWFEPRGAIWASIALNGYNIQIFNTHFGFRKIEQLPQAKALLGKDWLAGVDPNDPIIVCGDFNFSHRSAAYNLITKQFQDLQVELKGHRPLKTFPSRLPCTRIDHVFSNLFFKTVDVKVPRTYLTRNASDHLPLIIDVQLP